MSDLHRYTCRNCGRFIDWVYAASAWLHRESGSVFCDLSATRTAQP